MSLSTPDRRWLILAVAFSAIIVAAIAAWSLSPSPIRHEGQVIGTLETSGSPLIPVPLTGEVMLTNSTGHTYTVMTRNNGSFRIELPPGMYRIVGSSPEYDGGKSVCRTTTPFTRIAAGHTSSTNVICIEL